MGLVKELEKTTTINYLDGIVHLNGLQRFVDDFLISNTGYSSDFFLQSDHKCHSEQPRIRESDKGILCLERINNVQFVNKYLERINKSLDNGEYCMIRLETKDSRRVRILKKFPRIISRPYYAMDFVLKRLFPKWGPTKRIYFWLTQGNNRVISLTEALGRLVSCGFEIVAHQRVGYDTFIIGKKVREPHYDMEASFGMLVYLNRIGLNGKEFTVYKIRTMYPYSEYLQEYIFKKNNLQHGGKIKDDFRVTGYGKIFRKLWIDELPMIYNWLKGEMKLVGVRPLSKQYYNLYPQDIKELRARVKPGLVPPFYADMPGTLEEIVESERMYIQSYLEAPFRTDIRYFFLAFNNIIFKKARSK
jgi:lipopolysaccharide/colanic/teichoic acid biosynthesis glycosyltransferase